MFVNGCEREKKERKSHKEIDKKLVRCLGLCMRVHFYACVHPHMYVRFGEKVSECVCVCVHVLESENGNVAGLPNFGM